MLLKRCPIVFQGYPSNFKVTRLKKSSFFTQIGRFRTVTLVWIHQWLWNDAQSLKQHRRGAYCFSRSSVKFQGHIGQKIADFDPKSRIERFRTVTPVWIHPWLWNDAQSLMYYGGSALLFTKVVHQISRSRGTRKHPFWPELSVSGL